MELLQVHFGEPPCDFIRNAILSQRDWASRKGFDIVVLDEMPQKYKDESNPIGASEAVRIEYCATHENVLYLDYDVMLRPDFDFVPDRVLTDWRFPEAVFFNHTNLALFAGLRDEFEAYRDKYDREYVWPEKQQVWPYKQRNRLSKMCRRLRDETEHFPKGIYHHNFTIT